jgi:steroid 5-alpha reductase family enzyme
MSEPASETDARLVDWLAVGAAYALATAVGVGVYLWLDAVDMAAPFGPEPLWDIFLADVAATIVVYLFSSGFGNSSLYDPYWSVAPMVIAVAWWPMGDTAGSALRGWAVWGLIVIWGMRLTWNWAQGWGGLADEDWRYERLRRQLGWWYPAVNLLGIHLMPTFLVWLALWSAHAAMTAPTPVGWVDALAVAFGLSAIWLESAADTQLRRFKADADEEAVMSRGLWAYVRHPNYLGELGFWWALFALAAAAGAFEWQLLAGPVAMMLLFAVISIPMMEARLRRRRPDYREYMEQVPPLFPRPYGSGEQED